MSYKKLFLLISFPFVLHPEEPLTSTKTLGESVFIEDFTDQAVDENTDVSMDGATKTINSELIGGAVLSFCTLTGLYLGVKTLYEKGKNDGKIEENQRSQAALAQEQRRSQAIIDQAQRAAAAEVEQSRAEVTQARREADQANLATLQARAATTQARADAAQARAETLVVLGERARIFLELGGIRSNTHIASVYEPLRPFVPTLRAQGFDRGFLDGRNRGQNELLAKMAKQAGVRYVRGVNPERILAEIMKSAASPDKPKPQLTDVQRKDRWTYGLDRLMQDYLVSFLSEEDARQLQATSYGWYNIELPKIKWSWAKDGKPLVDAIADAQGKASKKRELLQRLTRSRALDVLDLSDMTFENGVNRDIFPRILRNNPNLRVLKLPKDTANPQTKLSDPVIHGLRFFVPNLQRFGCILLGEKANPILAVLNAPALKVLEFHSPDKLVMIPVRTYFNSFQKKYHALEVVKLYVPKDMVENVKSWRTVQKKWDYNEEDMCFERAPVRSRSSIATRKSKAAKPKEEKKEAQESKRGTLAPASASVGSRSVPEVRRQPE